MKILKILFISFFVLIVLIFIGALIFIKTFDANKYKPQIIEQAQKALRRNVGIGNISLNLSLDKGISLNVKDLTVADDPLFSAENFIKVKEVQIGVDVAAFLSQRQIIVSRVDVKWPQAVIIRNKQGVVNSSTIAKKPESPSGSSPTVQQPTSPETTTAPDSSAQPTAVNLPPVFVKNLQLDGGTIIYKDQTLDPSISIEVSQLQLNVKDFSLNDSFDFSLRAVLFSPIKNIDIKGTAQVDLDTTSVILSDVRINSDLSDISIDVLERSLPMIKTAGLKEIDGDLSVEIDKAVFGPAGLTKLSLEGRLKNGRKRLSQLPTPLTNILVNFAMTENTARIKDSSFNLGRGSVSFEGLIEDYLKAQKFHFETKADGLELAEIIPQKDQPVQLWGKLADEFTIDGKGFTPEALNNLTGKGSIVVQEGKLKNINVLKVILSKISMIPNLVEDVEQSLPEKYKEKMNDKDTSFNKINFKTTVHNGALYVDEAIIEADAFLLSGQGTIGFDNSLSLDTHVLIPKDLSESMAASAPPLQFILDEQGQIFIPVKVSGKIPNLTFLPDLNYLTKRLFETRGREELEKVLDKVFGRGGDSDGESTQPPSTGGEPQPPEQQQKSKEQELIEGLLDSIFN